MSSNSKLAARVAERHAALVGQSTHDADGLPLRYPSVLIRTQRDYGEGGAMVPRGAADEVGEAKDFLRQLGQKVASHYLLGQTRFSSDAPARIAGMDASPLDGLRKQKVLDILNRLLDPFTKGLHRDQYWAPIQGIRKVLDEENIPAVQVAGSGRYEKDPKTGQDIRKVWDYDVEFVNQNKRPDKVRIHIVASGAGSVDDPLAIYDVVAYAS